MSAPPDNGPKKPAAPGATAPRAPTAPAVPAVPAVPAMPAAAPRRPTSPAVPTAAPPKPAAPGVPRVPAVPAVPSPPAAARPQPPVARPPGPPVVAPQAAVPRVGPPAAPAVAPAVAPVRPAAAARPPPPTATARAAPPPPPAKAAPAPLVSPELLAELEIVSSALSQMDYFQLLKLDASAVPAQIKKAFHVQSRAYHPDRFFQLSDTKLKDRIHEVYKRITEAYYVLRDDAKRTRYLADVTGPERAQKLRFSEDAESEAKKSGRKQLEEEIGSHPKGRQFFQTGMTDFEGERWSAAERNFKMALTYEPQNPRYKEKLKQAQDKLHELSKDQGGSFKIR